MYLSRVEMDLANRKNIKDLSHLGAFHNWVEQSFPDEIRRGERSRKLWRLDTINKSKYLIIVSKDVPDLIALEQYGVEGSAQTKDYNPFLNNIKNGMEGRFRVVLNPVISIKEESDRRGRVVPHITVEQQRRFLLNRAEKNGFFLREEDFSIVERSYEPFKRENNRAIRLSKVAYEGNLTVQDETIFRKTLTEGFGKKKAYGFGLMTLIPMVLTNDR